MTGQPIRLEPRNVDGARRAIDRLRAKGRSGPIGEGLDQALRTGLLPEDVLVQHSRWCNTAHAFSGGIDDARDAALMLYGFVPERLVDEAGKPYPQSARLLTDYRRRIEGG